MNDVRFYMAVLLAGFCCIVFAYGVAKSISQYRKEKKMLNRIKSKCND